MRRILTLIIFSLLIIFSAHAQNATKISGIIKDEEGKNLPMATVTLLKAKDSALVKMAVTDKQGTYEFINIAADQYLLNITSVGYAKAIQNITVTTDKPTIIPAITLTASATSMAGVTVQSRRPLVENKIDKMVVNVDASPSNAGANALEVLEKSPGISVDRDGNISIKGKQGIIVLMDGKQTYLSGQDLANLLRNMPASQLDQIEIMTQPSAKFDASGNSGIINLRTRKNTQMGFNGSVNLSYVQGRYPKTPNSFSFNYRKGNVNVFTNLSYSYWSGFSEQNLLRKFSRNGVLESAFDQQADQKNWSSNFSGRVGLDYSLNKTTSIGFLINGTTNRRHWENDGRANIYNGAWQLDSFNTVQTVNNDKWNNFGAALNFKKILNAAGKEFTADVDVIQYKTNSKMNSDNYNYYPNGTLLDDPFILRGNLPSDITIYSGRIDYVHPLTKESKFEAGFKSSLVSTDNDAQYVLKDFDQNKWVTDNSRSNRFMYKENINAAYVNYNRQYKKLGVQLGLRMENTVSNGDQTGNAIQKDSSFTKNYTQLFPTAYVSYALNDNNQFALSYGRRIDRPNYQDMNPFQYLLDQYTYRQGNPNLGPQFTHNIELSHNYHKALNTTINYTYTTDIFNDILKQNYETKVTYQTKENVASRRNIGVAISYNAAITKWWTTSVFTNVSNNHYKGFVNNAPLDVKLTSLMANMNQQFRFAKTWSAEVSGFYRTRSQETGLFLLEPMGVISFGMGKQLFKNKGSLKLSVIDPFYIQKVKVNIQHSDIDVFVKNQWDNRRVGLSFTYRFSKGQNVQQSKRKSSAQEEQNRVGSGNQ